MNDTLKKFLIGSLGAGAAGGGLAGLISMNNDVKGESKKERRKRILTNSLLGAGLGAGVGSLPAGLDLLKGRSGVVEGVKPGTPEQAGILSQNPHDTVSQIKNHLSLKGGYGLNPNMSSSLTNLASYAGGGLNALGVIPGFGNNKGLDAMLDNLRSQNTSKLLNSTTSALDGAKSNIAAALGGKNNKLLLGSSVGGGKRLGGGVNDIITNLKDKLKNSGNPEFGRLKDIFNNPEMGSLKSPKGTNLQQLLGGEFTKELAKQLDAGSGFGGNSKLYAALRARGLGEGSLQGLSHADTVKAMNSAGRSTTGTGNFIRRMLNQLPGNPGLSGIKGKIGMGGALKSTALRGLLGYAAPQWLMKSLDVGQSALENPNRSDQGEAYTYAIIDRVKDVLKKQRLDSKKGGDVDWREIKPMLDRMSQHKEFPKNFNLSPELVEKYSDSARYTEGGERDKLKNFIELLQESGTVPEFGQYLK